MKRHGKPFRKRQAHANDNNSANDNAGEREDPIFFQRVRVIWKERSLQAADERNGMNVDGGEANDSDDALSEPMKIIEDVTSTVCQRFPEYSSMKKKELRLRIAKILDRVTGGGSSSGAVSASSTPAKSTSSGNSSDRESRFQSILKSDASGEDDDNDDSHSDDDSDALGGGNAKRPREDSPPNALSKSLQSHYAAINQPKQPQLQQQESQQLNDKDKIVKPEKKKAKKLNKNQDNKIVDADASDSTTQKKELNTFFRPTVRFKDVGGAEHCLQEIREICQYPLLHPELYSHLGVEPPRGFLLHGPPGCGKTLLAHAIAGEFNVPFFKIAAPEVVSGMSGESEEKIRSLFLDAQAAAPAIIFIDEIDAIAPKRDETNRGMERRIVAQLLTCMDTLFADLGNFSNSESNAAKPITESIDIIADSKQTSEMEVVDTSPAKQQQQAPTTSTPSKKPRPNVIVIGATNRPDAIDPALRRAGRFDREISMGIPDEKARKKILEVLASKMKLSGDFNFQEIATLTSGFVGADLAALTKEAAVTAVNRIFSAIENENLENGQQVTGESVEVDLPIIGRRKRALSEEEIFQRERVSEKLRSQHEPLTEEQLAPLCITMDDFRKAVKKVQPSAKREGFATAPSVTWDDIGALKEVREELAAAITDPIKYRNHYKRMGLSIPSGVLLFGPPGCGKTMVAKAIAGSSGSSFISIRGPELLNKYVGESERAVRQVFERAEASAPCVIFFDELDAICPRRGMDSGNWGVGERVSLQLLTLMDGLNSRGDVFVIGATNRPDVIDQAMLRPGRLNRLLYVPLPSVEDRADIIKTCCRKIPIADGIDFEDLGRNSSLDRFSGADLASFVREAASLALRRVITQLKGTISEASLLELGYQDDDQPLAKVEKSDFIEAMKRVRPSVSEKDLQGYLSMKQRLQSLQKD